MYVRLSLYAGTYARNVRVLMDSISLPGVVCVVFLYAWMYALSGHASHSGSGGGNGSGSVICLCMYSCTYMSNHANLFENMPLCVRTYVHVYACGLNPCGFVWMRFALDWVYSPRHAKPRNRCSHLLNQ